MIFQKVTYDTWNKMGLMFGIHEDNFDYATSLYNQLLDVVTSSKFGSIQENIHINEWWNAHYPQTEEEWVNSNTTEISWEDAKGLNNCSDSEVMAIVYEVAHSLLKSLGKTASAKQILNLVVNTDFNNCEINKANNISVQNLIDKTVEFILENNKVKTVAN